jgi:hypothetical protein
LTPQDDLDRRFDSSPPNEDRTKIHNSIRGACKVLAQHLNDLVPDGPEKNLAFQFLEETMMWSNKGVANADRRPEGRAS